MWDKDTERCHYLRESWRLLTFSEKKGPGEGGFSGGANRAGASARIKSVTGGEPIDRTSRRPLISGQCKSRASASDQALSESLTQFCNRRRHSATVQGRGVGLRGDEAERLSEKPAHAPAECHEVTDPDPAVQGPPRIVGRRTPVVGALRSYQPKLRADRSTPYR